MGCMSRFDRATRVRADGDGRCTADLDPGYLIGTAMNGGYLMAVLQRAALLQSPGHPHPVSSAYHFLRPAGPGPAEVRAEVLKTGRTVTTLRTTLAQDGRDLVTGHIAAGRLDPRAAPDYTAAAPDIPPPEACRRFDPRRSATGEDGFSGRVEQYFTPRTWERLARRTEAPEPELAGHLRPAPADGDPADPADFLALAVDALPPVVGVVRPWRWAPTVELTWHMRAVPEPGPLAFRAEGRSAADGWFDESVELWDVKGRLVAQARQLARSGL